MILKPRLLAILLLILLLGGSFFFGWLTLSMGGPYLSWAAAPAPALTPEAGRASPVAASTPGPTPTFRAEIVPFGSMILEDGTVATATATVVPSRLLREEVLLEQYGASSFDEVEQMPDELRYFFTTTVGEVADFFAVRAEDLIILLRARNGGRLALRPADGAEGGIAGFSPRLWNGWAAPEQERFLEDMRAIERSGGLGFDWEARISWLAWSRGMFVTSTPAGLAADPTRFANGVAALARYLVRHGVTRDVATRDPELLQRRLDEAIAALARPPATPSEPPSERVQALRAAFRRSMDQQFGVALSEEDLVELVDRSPVAREVEAGALEVEQGAAQLLAATVQRYLEEARTARQAGLPLPWPFAAGEAEMEAQRLAVQSLGHTLAPWELERLLRENGEAPGALQERLESEAEASLFAWTRQRMDEGLQRSQRGAPLYVHEVSRLLQPLLATRELQWVNERELRRIQSDIEGELRRLPEFRAIHGELFFSANPFDPMPRLGQPFGVPVSYQSGGFHTGIDLRGERVGGKQPPIYSVEDGVVAHVGPLYCLREGACRGPHAIIIDHGNHVYSIYSHNSEATVQPGEQVEAGQMIGRQGSEGYSRGPHLHLEVHVGAPFSGNWEQPWRGGEFVDPWPWLPRETDE